VAAAWEADLAAAVAYADERRDQPAKSSSIYGGVPDGWTPAADEFIRAVMADMMDQQQSVPGLSWR
jgi:hypothetical protein